MSRLDILLALAVLLAALVAGGTMYWVMADVAPRLIRGG